MTFFTLQDFWKQHAVLFAIHTEDPIRRFQSVRVSVWEQLHIYIGENLTYSSHHGVWGDHHQRLWRNVFIHLPIYPHIQYRGRHLGVLEGQNADQDQEVGWWKILLMAIGICAMPHTQKNEVLAENISTTASHLTSDDLTFQIAFFLSL